MERIDACRTLVEFIRVCRAIERDPVVKPVLKRLEEHVLQRAAEIGREGYFPK